MYNYIIVFRINCNYIINYIIDTEIINLRWEKPVSEKYIGSFWFSRNYNFKITKEPNGTIFENWRYLEDSAIKGESSNL